MEKIFSVFEVIFFPMKEGVKIKFCVEQVFGKKFFKWEKNSMKNRNWVHISTETLSEEFC